MQHRAVLTAQGKKKIRAIAIFTAILQTFYQSPNPNSLWPILMLPVTQSDIAVLPVTKENIPFLSALIWLIFLDLNVDLFKFHTLRLE